MKRNFTTAVATIGNSLLYRKKKKMVQPVENNEIFDHLFIKQKNKKARDARHNIQNTIKLFYER